MGRNSSFSEGAGDDGIPQGPGLAQGPAMAQGEDASASWQSEKDRGWEGGLLSDIRHVATNPTQTPFIGQEIRVAANLARTGASYASGGSSELPQFAVDLAQGDPLGESASRLYRHSPFGITANYLGNTAQGLYQAGRLGSHLATNPTQITRWGDWAWHNRNQARHQIASVGSRTLRQMGRDYKEHPERVIGDVALTVATAGAAGAALKAARGAGVAGELGAATVAEGATAAGEIAGEAAGQTAAAAGRGAALQAAEDFGGAAAREATENVAGTAARTAAGEAVGEVAETASRSNILTRTLERFDETAQKGIEARIRNRPLNLVRRALGKDVKEFGAIGKLRNAASDFVAGEGGTGRELIAQRISASPYKPQFSSNMSDLGRSYGEMAWRRGVATGDIASARKLNALGQMGSGLEEANQAVRDPKGYAMGKVESALGIAPLTPEQIANETQRRSNESNMSNLPAPQPLQPLRPLSQPPSGPPAPPGGPVGSGQPQQYTMGRGFRTTKGRGGTGFWQGRPEFTGASFGYNRMQIRPLTVARGGGITRFDHALAAGAGALVGGRRSRETESNAQQVGGNPGVDPFGDAYKPPMSYAEGIQPANAFPEPPL